MRKTISAALLAFFMAGCGRSSPTSYYLLESGAELTTLPDMPSKTLRVAQVETPPYLNRNNIVSRVNGETRLILAEFHLWAEPVGAGVRRVVEEILTRPLYEKGIGLLPAGTENRGDYALLLDVRRMDGNFDEKAVLECWWTLIDRDDRTLDRGLYAAEEQVPGANYNVLAQAESKLLRDFGAYLSERLPPLLARGNRR